MPPCPCSLHAVHFLHSNHVQHLDLKTKNILLDLYGRAKVADVGLAELNAQNVRSAAGWHAAQAALQARPEEPAPFVGTLAYAAPEILKGEPHSEKADIFSLVRALCRAPL